MRGDSKEGTEYGKYVITMLKINGGIPLNFLKVGR
jgi:hypothetical protein